MVKNKAGLLLLTVLTFDTTDFGSTAAKSISPSLSGDDLNGGGAFTRPLKGKNQSQK